MKQNNLGGVSVWSLDMDDFKGGFCKIGKFPIIQSIRRELEGIVEPTTELPVTATTKSTRTKFTFSSSSSSFSSPTATSGSKASTKHIDIITKAKTTLRKTPSSSPVPTQQPPIYSINNKKMFNFSIFDIDWTGWSAFENRMKKFKAVRELKITACLDKHLCRVNTTANSSISVHSEHFFTLSLLLSLIFKFSFQNQFL